jgi:phosphoenolpyruvate synthase/pyruvate phosphate dikinase/rhodanese-related sulfurtransferase/membrane protein insertase Oxa1/YidC/SpoIIIJ
LKDVAQFRVRLVLPNTIGLPRLLFSALATLNNCARTVRWTSGHDCLLVAALGAFALCLIGTREAFAIPSPELVIGSFVSISQLFALASAVLGGGAAYATMQFRNHKRGSGNVARGLLYLSAGLFAVLAVSIGVNIWQYVYRANLRQMRLETTLTRPMPKPNGISLDPALKEVSYEEQLASPRGISTEELERILDAKARGERPDTVLLDMRETAETEMGILPGAKTVRLPDLKTSNIDFAGKIAIVYCHNGNRSYESCQALAALGIDCRFLVGGLEKWLVEKRRLNGTHARTLANLRALPSYRRQRALLDTNQVRSLVAKSGAVFVDVRYPGEFKVDHLPNAINLPIRPTPTAEFKNRLAQLQKKPIIVPCYDRRSCFFGEVLGLELVRAGYNFRGRYTVPWDFLTPGEPRPYLAEWLLEAKKGRYQKIAESLSTALLPIASAVGLVFTIILLAFVSRLMILPLAIKAERDQIRAKSASVEMDAIKLQLKDDPVRKTRAIRAFYKRHGITPGRNLLAMLILPIMAVALLAVQKLAAHSDAGFLWIQNLADRDGWLALPLIFGLLITAYLDLAFAASRIKKIVIWLIGLPAMTLTAALFPASADLYLITSAVLINAQRLWVSGQFAALYAAWKRAQVPKDIIPIEDVSRLKNCGNKAYRLARMRAAGLPVPDGLVLTPAFLKRSAEMSAAGRAQAFDWIWRHLGDVRLAVRSSGSGEDGANQSFAGVFESVINVDRHDLEAAIGRVEASFNAARVSSYQFSAGAGNILVQRMVDAEYAGVLFTRDPAAGGLAMIEMVQGTAEHLVSGTVRPRTYRFGRVTKQPLDSDTTPIDLGPLLQMGDIAEQLFGGSQDMEWTYRGGRFYLVQSRDITRPVAGSAEMAAKQNDLGRALDIAKGATADQVVFGKNELSEMLPRPTPLSLSLMKALSASGGSVDLAARELGLTYRVEESSNLLVTILGRLYVDKREEQRRSLIISAMAARRLLRRADRIERNFRENFLPQYIAETRLINVADFDKLSAVELIAEIKRLYERFVFETHVAVDAINIAAGFYLDCARKALTAAAIDPSVLLGQIPETTEARALAIINAASLKERQLLLLKNFGHRAVLDYELAERRYAEDIGALNHMVAGRVQTIRKAYQGTVPLTKVQTRVVEVARRFQTLKEDAKHHSLNDMAILRRAILTLDRQCGLDGLVFWLDIDDLLSLNTNNVAHLRDVAIKRKEVAQLLSCAASLASTLRPRDIEAASAGDTHDKTTASGVIRGTRVSGSKVVEARAIVISDDDAETGKAMEGFRDGDIVVAPMINPAWLPYFSRAGGFVSEVGGWLSHPAILAREYDVTMIVGTEGIDRVANGDLLRLNLDGQIEVISKPALTDVA